MTGNPSWQDYNDYYGNGGDWSNNNWEGYSNTGGYGNEGRYGNVGSSGNEGGYGSGDVYGSYNRGYYYNQPPNGYTYGGYYYGGTNYVDPYYYCQQPRQGEQQGKKTQSNEYNVQGNNYNIMRNNYYNDYITRYNNIYITDYKDQNGCFCYRKILIVPKQKPYVQRQYVGSNWGRVKK